MILQCFVFLCLLVPLFAEIRRYYPDYIMLY